VTQTQSGESAAATPEAKSLPARFAGVLFAPRATYAAVAARPQWLGMFLVVYLITATATTTLMSTEVGRTALLDQQIASSESFTGRPMTQEQIDRMEQFSKYALYTTPVFQLFGLSIGCLFISGLAFAVFNALLGGDAAFRQVFAIVTHSGAILATLSLFTTPLAYARASLSGTTNLAVFLPFLEDTSFAARFLGSIDLIFIWWMLSVAIGFGVLYRKRTAPIAATMFVIYAAIGLIIAAIKTASTGV
jgi:hypothetical protein